MSKTNDNNQLVGVANAKPQAAPPTNEVFIRVGTTLYKVVDQPTINGGKVRKRIPWNMETLRQDYGKEFIKYVHKYDGFCTVPEHVNHRTVIDGFLNLYEPIGHKPMQGGFPNIKKLVSHIFGEQYELGMDYLQLLYLRPVQKLPILFACIRGKKHRQDHVLELSEGIVPGQRDIQHQRGLPQSVQLRLGWQTAHSRGRGIAQPQGGFRAVEEPQHHTLVQGGSQGQGQERDFLLCQVRAVLQQRITPCHH